MMKQKWDWILCAAILCTVLTACGNSADSANGSAAGAPNTDTGSASVSSQAKPDEEKKEFNEEDYLDNPGVGSFGIGSPTDTYIDGGCPVIYVSKEDTEAQIDLSVSDFDTSMLAYIYVDGVLNTKQQLTNDTFVTIYIAGDAMTPDTNEADVLSHKVELVQYENDDEDGKVVTYKFAHYIIKIES